MRGIHLRSREKLLTSVRKAKIEPFELSCDAVHTTVQILEVASIPLLKAQARCAATRDGLRMVR